MVEVGSVSGSLSTCTSAACTACTTSATLLLVSEVNGAATCRHHVAYGSRAVVGVADGALAAANLET